MCNCTKTYYVLCGHLAASRCNAPQQTGLHLTNGTSITNGTNGVNGVHTNGVNEVNTAYMSGPNGVFNGANGANGGAVANGYHSEDGGGVLLNGAHDEYDGGVYGGPVRPLAPKPPSAPKRDGHIQAPKLWYFCSGLPSEPKWVYTVCPICFFRR